MRLFISILLIFGTVSGFPQVKINTTFSVEESVKRLEGDGVLIENIQYQYDLMVDSMFRPIGLFYDEVGVLGITNGVILTNGAAKNAIGPNNNPARSQVNAFDSYEDPDLQTLISDDQFLYDLTIIEFDITAYSDVLSFNYVFASEEYPEFLEFNDAFGFFLSGPGIGGSVNIALIPGTNTPVSVSNINQNVNSQYFISNGNGSTPFDNPEIQYDGYTVVLKAEHEVLPCETYHIKLAISDVNDSNLDSGVFLEEGSFTSLELPELSVEFEHERFPYLVEGCNNGTLHITRDENEASEPLALDLMIEGSADMGLDFDSIPLSVNFAANELTKSFPLNTILDSIPESVESIKVVLLSLCDKFPNFDEIEIDIRDKFTLTNPTLLKCGAGELILNEDHLETDSFIWDAHESLSCLDCATPNTDIVEDFVYTFTVYDSVSGCVGKGTQAVNYENVNADFDLFFDECKTSIDLDVLNRSSNATSYLWDFGDGTSSTEENPEHTYEIALNATEPQDFWVSLTATNTQLNCVSTKKKMLTINEPLFSPNIITPNNDLINDSFTVRGLTESCWSFYIYNRWGKLVYFEEEFTNRFEPKSLRDGLYYFHLKNDNDQKDYKGHFTIVR